MFKRLFKWLDRTTAGYLDRRGMGESPPPRSELPGAHRRPRMLTRPGGSCPCGALWLHNERGDREAHRQWLMRSGGR